MNQRPEFLWALKVAREFAWGKALDLGCGQGAFLDLDRNQGLTTRGLELNVQAAAHGRKKGHQVYAGPLSDFSRDHPDERFDLITAFQVVRTGADPLLGLDARHFWLLHNRLALALGKKRYPGGDRLARLLAFVYRKSGCKYILPHWGSNIYVLY